MAKTDIDNTLRILSDLDETIPAAVIYELSDIGVADFKKYRVAWPGIPLERRLLLLQRLGEVSETNFDMNFTTVTRLALLDTEEELRKAAVEALWYDEELDLLHKLMDMAQHDPADEVRAEALSALGRFILMGELGNLSAAEARGAQDVAIAIYNDADELIEVRRRAIEALGNCTRSGVLEMIEESYESDEPQMRISAVFAMGRSCDPDWEDTILQELANEDAEMRYEAARASGELELDEAVPVLAERLNDEDREVMEMAVWALGEIGGNQARHLLEDLIERAALMEDESLVEAIEEALESASLVGESLRFDN